MLLSCLAASNMGFCCPTIIEFTRPRYAPIVTLYTIGQTTTSVEFSKFYNRARVHCPGPKNIVEDAENHCTTKHNNAVVHRRWLHWRRWGPEAEEPYNNQIADSEDVVCNAEDSRNPPWSPRKRRTRHVRELSRVPLVREDMPLQATMEQKRRGQEIRSK